MAVSASSKASVSVIQISTKVDWMLESFQFPRGPSMYGINYQQSVYML